VRLQRRLMLALPGLLLVVLLNTLLPLPAFPAAAYNKQDTHGKSWADPKIFDAPLTQRGRQQVCAQGYCPGAVQCALQYDSYCVSVAGRLLAHSPASSSCSHHCVLR
jgi:hypothetical protein